MKKRILVVGQTPPPYGGQAMMIKFMLDAQYECVELIHVRMHFSRDFNERGHFSLYKIKHLLFIIIKIWVLRFKKKVNILYYPLSSSPKVALLRDVLILLFTRFLFTKTIYHFHAAGVSEELPNYCPCLRHIIFLILRNPDLTITSSSLNPKDGEFLKAKSIKVIPLGIPDENVKKERLITRDNAPLTVLFVGLMNSTKGEGYILEAINLLAQKGKKVNLWLAGKFESEEYKKTFFEKIDSYGLKEQVKYWGIVTGEKKKSMFLSADVFCFPSFFSSESFGMVLLEAMMYQMPLIATKWRGIQSVIEEGKNGFLVEVKNANDIANRIELFYNNRDLLSQMGSYSRMLFEEKYKINVYLSHIEEEFKSL